MLIAVLWQATTDEGIGIKKIYILELLCYLRRDHISSNNGNQALLTDNRRGSGPHTERAAHPSGWNLGNEKGVGEERNDVGGMGGWMANNRFPLLDFRCC